MIKLFAAILGGLAAFVALTVLAIFLLPPGGEGVAIFIFVVLLVVFFHELGHFATAKWFGIKVEEFFIGFGPRIWSTRRDETEYGIKAIPAGGYVRIAGMNPFQEPPPEDRDRVFTAKPAWQRAVVLVAGSLTHFILAFVLLGVYFGAIGMPERFAPRIGAVEQRLGGRPSPASEAGLQAGDEFVAVDGREIRDYEQFVEYTRFRAGSEIEVVVEREGERRTFRVTPVESLVEGQVVGRLGVILTPGTILERERLGPGAAVGRAGSVMGDFVSGTFTSLGRIFGPEGLSRLGRQLFGDEPRDPARDPTGVVGAARLSGQATAAGRLDELLFLFVAFNVFVGIMNLLPLPPLDGGHLAMVAVEKLRGGRPVDPRRVLPLTAAVVAILFVFFISVTFLDITEPLPNPFD